MAPNPRAIPEDKRQMYAKLYAQNGVMTAAFEYFKSFNTQNAEDNRKFAGHKLPMPVLIITGDKSMGKVLEMQAKIVADNITVIELTDTGHWLMKERPVETKSTL